jgi:ABC-2 type transporter
MVVIALRGSPLAEMMQGQNPVACADEISTGLDAAVTYDIVHSIVAFAKAAMTTRIVSLLQPGPETFSLFDEVIVLAKGYIIYAGPIDEVIDYFAALGYSQKSTMDVADFLQLIPTPDGEMLFDPEKSSADEHYTAERFAEAFRQSEQYMRISEKLDSPSRYNWKARKMEGDGETGRSVGKTVPGVPKEFKIKYQNSFLRTAKLNLARHLTLWKRDKGFIIGKMFENIGMAVATGGILFGNGNITWNENAPIDQETADKVNKLSAGIYGALFMTTFHVLLGKTCVLALTRLVRCPCVHSQMRLRL